VCLDERVVMRRKNLMTAKEKRKKGRKDGKERGLCIW
jgi:hypothetical protein